jgi:hypothetical protein
MQLFFFPLILFTLLMSVIWLHDYHTHAAERRVKEQQPNNDHHRV